MCYRGVDSSLKGLLLYSIVISSHGVMFLIHGRGGIETHSGPPRLSGAAHATSKSIRLLKGSTGLISFSRPPPHDVTRPLTQSQITVHSMTFAYTTSYTPIGGFGPTAEQRRHQNQRDCPHGMKQQHNTFLSVLLDKKAHDSAAALCSLGCSLATRSATAADPLPVSTPPYSSHWASFLLAACHGTFSEVV